MKKLESTWYNMAIVLTVISVVAGAALAYVNEMTKGPIAEIQQRNEAQAIKAVLCDDNAVVTDTIEGEAGVVVYLTDNGAAIKTVDPQNGSFSGGLTVMVGLNKEFQVLGYTVLVSNETPGLGAEIVTEKFRNPFIGKELLKNGKFASIAIEKAGTKVEGRRRRYSILRLIPRVEHAGKRIFHSPPPKCSYIQ